MFWFLLASPATASDFMDVWVTTAFEDSNVLAGPDAYSPSPNFVNRGNSTFFENYENRTTDDVTRSSLVLYRKDDGFVKNVVTEAAFALRLSDSIDPRNSFNSLKLEDDGSYVNVAYKIGGKDDHRIGLTGYAVNADRFRLGYSYDLTWGGRSMFVFDPGVAPGVRLQYQKGSFYTFVGAKATVGDYVDKVTNVGYLQAYYGGMAGLGGEIGDHLRLEAGAGSFQQGQLLAEASATSPLYGEFIKAVGVCGQVSVRTNPELDYIVSNELKLYRNAPQFMRDTYITHRTLEGAGLLVQAEGNYLAHNLLDPEKTDSTTVEGAFAGDVQALFVAGATEIGADFVYKDLSYIVFNIPGLTSGYATPASQETSPQIYGRARVGHYFEKAHLTPSLGAGLMQPAAYKTGDGYYVQFDAQNVYPVPAGQQPAALLSSVVGLQWDVSKSVVGVGEVLYTLNNNLSNFVQIDEELGEYQLAPGNWRNQVGFNLMLRARF